MPRTRTTQPAIPTPLGSLTQRGARTSAFCTACGSISVTQISMNLADGSPVELVSCHTCEHRAWTEDGQAIEIAGVLDKARRR